MGWRVCWQDLRVRRKAAANAGRGPRQLILILVAVAQPGGGCCWVRRVRLCNWPNCESTGGTELTVDELLGGSCAGGCGTSGAGGRPVREVCCKGG